MRYDLHVHTYHSQCSNMRPRTIIEYARQKGLDGIAITDHNTIAGALETKKLNKHKDFEVIVGEEIVTDSGEILAYYLTEPIKPGPLEDVILQAKAQSAIVALAHPTDRLRKHFDWQTIKKYATRIHAVETFNSRTLNPFYCGSGYKLAKQYTLASVAGSDAHFWFEIGGAATIFKGSLRNAIKNRATSTEGSSRLGPLGIISTCFYKIIKQVHR